MNPSPHPLDNPIWSALATRQAALRLGDDMAWRYPPDVAPFAAVAADTPAAWRALTRLLHADAPVALLSDAPLAAPDGLHAQTVGVIHQMVATRSDATPPDTDMMALGVADVPDMMALAQKTRPGPFCARTHEMGRYLGIRQQGRLIAMAGERMRPDGYVEISAVCVDAAWRGKGLAGRMIQRLQHDIRLRGDTPFLHVLSDNGNAIALYERLGFTLRRRFFLGLMSHAPRPTAASAA